MSTADVDRLRGIKTFPSLVKYLRDELDWPIDSDNFEDLTFDYEPEELGLDAKTGETNHPVARRATPPKSGGKPQKNSPPQMRRGGALGDGVVLNRRPRMVAQ